MLSSVISKISYVPTISCILNMGPSSLPCPGFLVRVLEKSYYFSCISIKPMMQQPWQKISESVHLDDGVTAHVRREEQIDAGIQTAEEQRRAFAIRDGARPDCLTESLADVLGMRARVEQMQIGQRTLAQPCNAVARLASNGEYTHIEGFVRVSGLGYPLLHLNPLRTEHINQLSDHGLLFIYLDFARIIEARAIDIPNQRNRRNCLVAPPVISIGHHTRCDSACRQLQQ